MPLIMQEAPQMDVLRGEEMRTPDEVSAMVRLKGLGWGVKRIAAELGCSKNTVRRYLALGSWRPCASPSRSKKLDGLEAWLSERFRRHGGNADVVRQELLAEHGLAVSLRTVERAVAPLRRELLAAARATVRFETRPGEQLQIDFGERRVEIGGRPERVFLFVATLGYSRRLFVRAFGGVPQEVLLDNARALVLHHDPVSREVVLHPRLHAFARHWGFRVRACAPYRARTKGKDERGVAYVKRNAIAGRRFATWPELEAHLVAWTREIADQRLHGTTGEAPLVRFARDEAGALKPLSGIPPFSTARDLVRRVASDCAVEVDGNAYSVPWRLIGERVQVTVGAGAVRVLHAGREVAVHAELPGRRGRAIDPDHFAGVSGARGLPMRRLASDPVVPEAPALLRPLAEYEALVGGGF